VDSQFEKKHLHITLQAPLNCTRRQIGESRWAVCLPRPLSEPPDLVKPSFVRIRCQKMDLMVIMICDIRKTSIKTRSHKRCIIIL